MKGAAVTADEPTPETGDEPTPEDDKGKTKPNDIKAMEAALRKANKEAADTRAKLKELEDRDKTESERLTGRVADLEKQLAESTSRVTRYEVALDKGLTKTQARRLVGDSEEDLLADADDLLASFKPTEPAPEAKPPPGSPPKETLRPGAAPAEPEPSAAELRKAVAEIPRDRKSVV